jgi:hypothetical protein
VEPAPVAAAGAAPGYPGEGELLGRYRQDSGRDLSGLGFYIALACFKLAVILEGIHYRHLHGQTVGAGYEHVGALAEPLAEDFPLAAAFAGIRTLRLADGPDEVHKNALARTELKRQRARRDGTR